MTEQQKAEYATSVAIIGMAGRFPGAATVDAFWANIAGGVRSIRDFTDEELLAAGVSPQLLRDPNYVKAGAPIDGAELFDAGFFGFPPREAEIIDPQHRLFLECAAAALEDAAYVAGLEGQGAIGVFAGSAPSTYVSAGSSGSGPMENRGDPFVSMHNAPDSLASTVSYRLNLRGPSIAVQTFCSTSLVAVHMACQSLLTYECKLALAGGVAIGIPQGVGYRYRENGIESPDGHCRAFDARARGSVMGSGVGVVALKRMEDALADRDHIYCVIRGSAVNNDGLRKVGYTAPGMAGQMSVIATALRRAEVDASTVTYVEAHGTGTALGDSVELEAMTRAFRRTTAKKRYCAIGSLKPNIGHLDRAAGVAGLIKAALALDRRLLPPSIDFESPNPDLDLVNSPFYVNTELRVWPDEGAPRRAGVSSYGAGGTNAHVVMEEAPAFAAPGPSRPDHCLLLSARTETALQAAASRLAAFLRDHDNLPLADVAWTLAVGREVFNHRRVVVCRDLPSAVRDLQQRDPDRALTAEQVQRNRPVTFLFSDVEKCESPELYSTEPEYRSAVDRCRTMPGAHGVPDSFALQYGLAMLLIRWGIQPKAVIGHGIGELVAACVAGVMTLEQALALASGRTSGSALSFEAPRIPMFSGRTAGWVTPEQATSAGFWLTPSLSVPPPLPVDDGILLELGPPSVNSSASWMRTLGSLWLAGVSIDWSAVYSSETRRRVSLPSYPFERQRYWLESAAKSAAAEPTDDPARVSDISDWFYVPSWKRSVVEAPANRETHTFLLLADDCGISARLADWLVERGHRAITVRPGEGYRESGDGSFTVRPGERADYHRLLRDLDARRTRPGRVVHAWLIGGDEPAGESAEGLTRATRLGFYGLLALTQALGDASAGPCQITVISTGMQDVEAGDGLTPSKATALGLCRVIPQEYDALRCRAVDIALPGSSASAAAVVEQLGRELLAEARGEVVALRGPHRWVEAFEPVRLPAVTPAARLRQQGVYLITGGLGGIGLAMAEFLASTVNARLVLVGRSALPPREQWPKLLASHEQHRDVVRRIQAVQSLESRGIQILVLKADVADPSQMEAVVARAMERFGVIHGVLHAAGVPGAGLIALKSAEAAARVLAPKVEGTLALTRALAGAPLDFLVLFSSVASAGGGPGQVDYCAANSFLEAYARRRRGEHGITVAIGWCEWLWDAWQEGLLGFPEEIRAALRGHRHKYGLSFDEGVEVLRRVLSADLPHLYVATFDLNRLLRDSRAGLVAGIVEQIQRRRAARPSYPRPPLASSFVEPRDPLETQIAGVWQEVLGVAAVGIHDNFFELGGNSLLGMDLVARLRRSLDFDIPAQLLYEAPTISALSAHVRGTEGTPGAAAGAWQTRGEKRRERFRQAQAGQSNKGTL